MAVRFLATRPYDLPVALGKLLRAGSALPEWFLVISDPIYISLAYLFFSSRAEVCSCLIAFGGIYVDNHSRFLLEANEAVCEPYLRD